MAMRKKSKVKCVVFDEESRKDFISGFHKRKVARRKHFEEKLQREWKEAKKRVKAQARETMKQIIGSSETLLPTSIPYEETYELPEHTVTVQELNADDIAKENNWIGENKSNNLDQNRFGNLTSLKAIKKVISKKCKETMMNDEIFKKKTLVEKRKNKKKAAKAKKYAQKQEKKKKRR